MRTRKHRVLFHAVASVLVVNALLWGSHSAYQAHDRYATSAKERVLRQRLRTMRTGIDRFTADMERAPRTLAELVEAHYLDEVPIDPMTGTADWKVILEDEPISATGERGIADVTSTSNSGDGTGTRPYPKW